MTIPRPLGPLNQLLAQLPDVWDYLDGPGAGSPVGATYITQTPHATLTGEQALSALATGLLKNTTTTGVLSIATPGTDYTVPTDLVAVNVKRHGAAGDGSTDDRSALHTLLNTTLASSGGLVYFPTGDYRIASALTIPNKVRLLFNYGARLAPDTGVTVTNLAAIIDTMAQIFAGAGNISFAGNQLMQFLRAAWYGVVGDDTTDCTAIIQKIWDQLNTDNFSTRLIYPPGKILIAGALQDTSLSNSQLVLPKRTGDQLSLILEGSGAVTSLVGIAGTGGTTFKSTLASGTGAMIGCKTTSSFFASSNLNVWMKGISFETVANPTITVLDMRYVKRFFLQDFRVWTGEAGNWTQPTTSTSFGIRTPIDNIVSDGAVVSGVVSGFYNSIEVNELAYLNNIQEGPSEYGYTFTANHHPVLAGRIGSYFSKHTTRFTGAATVLIEELDIERSSETGKWYSVANLVNDFSEATAGDAHGRIGYLLVNGLTATVEDNQFVIGGTAGDAGKSIWIYNLHSNSRNYNYVEPLLNMSLDNPAVFELNQKVATSTNSDYALMVLGAKQNGTAHAVANIAFMNSTLLGSANDRRLANIGVQTDGATNSGAMFFSTWNAGTFGLRLGVKKAGVAIYGLPVYANNAAAVTGGLVAGDLYRTGGDPDPVCVVH